MAVFSTFVLLLLRAKTLDGCIPSGLGCKPAAWQ
jgi:hypothetical protein